MPGVRQTYRTIVRKDGDARALGRIAHAIAEAEDPLEVVQSLAEAAVSLVDASGAYVERFAANHDDVEIIAAVGLLVPSVGTRVPYPGSLTEELVAKGAPEVLPGLTEENRPIAEVLRQICGRCGALVIPLRPARDVLGGLVLLRRQEESAFTPQDVERLQLLTDLTSIVFARARLLDEMHKEHARLRRSEQRERLLAEATSILGASLKYEDTLQSITRLVVPLFCDWCTVDILEGARGIRRVALTHEDPAQEAFARELMRRYAPDAAGDVLDVIRTGESQLLREVPPGLLRRAARDATHEQLLRSLGFDSAVIVPIKAHNKVLGALTMVSSRPERRYDEEDLRFAEALAERSGFAIENARLHAQAVESATRLKETLDRLGSAFFAFDDEWRLTFANPAGNELLRMMVGASGNDILGKNIWAVVPQVVGTSLERMSRQAMETQKPVHFEDFFAPGNAWIEMFVYPSPAGVSILARDVTQRRRALDAVTLLSEIGARLAAVSDYEEIVRIIAQAVVPAFADYCVIDVALNSHFQRIGYAHHSTEGEALLARTTSYPAVAASRIAKPLHTGNPLLIEMLTEDDLRSLSQNAEHRAIIDRLGPRSLLSVPLAARGRRLGVMVLARTKASGRRFDLADTEVGLELGRRAGSAIEKARLQARAEQAVRARDEVLGVVAHDLRNPVHTIAMSASILEDLPLGEEDRRKQLAIIKRSTQRANRLIADLLDVTKIEAGELALVRKPVDVNELLHEVCDLFGLLAGAKKFEFECHVDEHLPPISADRDRMMQVFSNLLGNAIKFTPEGAWIRVAARAHGNTIQFAVIDSGMGIPEDQLPNLFNRFWQAKRGKEGAGLGLSIVKGIVEAHGGETRVESVIDRGTTFTFTVPIATASLQPAT